MQVLGAGEQCTSELQAYAQHLLGLFAQPILDRIAQEPVADFSKKYGSNYSATPDTFLYDHVKVQSFGVNTGPLVLLLCSCTASGCRVTMYKS